ncbi:DoxX family protein [Staphylococcus agnetis]|uniref:DoxX family protein n=1 Tax=Staphylococcus agnetis TaxID=985762 RepID=UPI0004E42937|nr:membrane protein [Staphylococcus agnetis]KFE40712.1 hypothetical protein SAGN_11635 [Staphylococcus agnetis]NJH64392.1 hypothetical protein [Staphylococcus agnetis]NJH97746.1 hypothetical protein [Staphylococcus agnetis]PTH45472.1 hypothetical protein BU587_10325 [Staphylococcus agnetis]PTH71715.1 hypothetical protein BU581_11090 [Staphylococcus agnetis]
MKRFQRVVFGILFVFIGILHFARETTFRKIVPHYLPFRKAAVLITGVCEIVFGIGLFIRRPSYVFKHIMIAFLWAVLPANIYMARHIDKIEGLQFPKSLLYLRIPLQFQLMKWIRHL